MVMALIQPLIAVAFFEIGLLQFIRTVTKVAHSLSAVCLPKMIMLDIRNRKGETAFET